MEEMEERRRGRVGEGICSKRAGRWLIWELPAKSGGRTGFDQKPLAKQRSGSSDFRAPVWPEDRRAASGRVVPARH